MSNLATSFNTNATPLWSNNGVPSCPPSRYIGSGTYNGLQTRVVRRLTKGLQFTGAYTGSHTIDEPGIPETVNALLIAEILGWSPATMVRMSARYRHFGLEDLRGAVETISRNAEGEIDQHNELLRKSELMSIGPSRLLLRLPELPSVLPNYR